MTCVGIGAAGEASVVLLALTSAPIVAITTIGAIATAAIAAATTYLARRRQRP